MSTILANAYLPALQKRFADNTDSPLAGYILQGYFTDLTPGWYRTIGRSIMISMFFMIFVRLGRLVMQIALVKFKKFLARKAVYQQQLNDAFQSGEFKLDIR